jgi:hypothetical protein
MASLFALGMLPLSIPGNSNNQAFPSPPWAIKLLKTISIRFHMIIPLEVVN